MGEGGGELREAGAALDAGRRTAGELVEEALASAAPHVGERGLGLFASLRPVAARREAREAEERRGRGAPRSPLDGVPVAIKDNLVQEGEPCSCGSRMLRDFVAPYMGTAVARLRAAGAVIIGRTKMDEFAMGSSTEHTLSGPARNPWDAERTPGGSSGGSAGAVAAGIVPLALGSDTGGSVRQPAALCGVAGLKPSYGRISRYGLVAFASSLDQIGPLARSAWDCAWALELLAGHDPLDATSLPEAAPRYREALDGEAAGLTVGLPRECFANADAGVLAAVRGALGELERAGVKLREVSLPHSQYAVAAYYLIATAEASSNLARYDGVRYGHRAAAGATLDEMVRRSRSEGFGAEVKRRVMLGTYVLSAGYYDAYYHKATQLRSLLLGDFQRALEDCDVLALPTAPETAFRLGERTGDPLRMYQSDVFTVSANLTGLPALSVPCGFAGGLPVGLQLLGGPRDEATPLRLADAYQRRTDWHQCRPPQLRTDWHQRRPSPAVR